MMLSKDNLLLYFSVAAAIGVSVSFWKVYLFHIVMVLVIASYFFSRKSNSRFVFGVKYHHIFYVMIAWYSLSILWSVNRIYSVAYIFYIFCGAMLVLSVVEYSRTIEMQSRLGRALSYVFSIEIVISVLESSTSFRMPISPYSEYVHYFGREPDLEYIATISDLSLSLNTPTGFEWNPNNLAILMLILFPFYFFSMNKKRYVGVILIPLVIYMAESRGVLIAFVGVLFLCSMYVVPRKLVLYGVASAFLSLSVLYLISINPQAFESRKYQQMVMTVESLERYFSPNITYEDSIGIRKELINSSA